MVKLQTDGCPIHTHARTRRPLSCSPPAESDAHFHAAVGHDHYQPDWLWCTSSRSAVARLCALSRSNLVDYHSRRLTAALLFADVCVCVCVWNAFALRAETFAHLRCLVPWLRNDAGVWQHQRPWKPCGCENRFLSVFLPNCLITLCVCVCVCYTIWNWTSNLWCVFVRQNVRLYARPVYMFCICYRLKAAFSIVWAKSKPSFRCQRCKAKLRSQNNKPNISQYNMFPDSATCKPASPAKALFKSKDAN